MKDVEARSLRAGDLLSAKGAEVTATEYDSARNAYKITYRTPSGKLASIRIPANDLVVTYIRKEN